LASCSAWMVRLFQRQLPLRVVPWTLGLPLGWNEQDKMPGLAHQSESQSRGSSTPSLQTSWKRSTHVDLAIRGPNLSFILIPATLAGFQKCLSLPEYLSVLLDHPPALALDLKQGLNLFRHVRLPHRARRQRRTEQVHRACSSSAASFPSARRAQSSRAKSQRILRCEGGMSARADTCYRLSLATVVPSLPIRFVQPFLPGKRLSCVENVRDCRLRPIQFPIRRLNAPMPPSHGTTWLWFRSGPKPRMEWPVRAV
jgi:hypothetical protein